MMSIASPLSVVITANSSTALPSVSSAPHDRAADRAASSAASGVVGGGIAHVQRHAGWLGFDRHTGVARPRWPPAMHRSWPAVRCRSRGRSRCRTRRRGCRSGAPRPALPTVSARSRRDRPEISATVVAGRSARARSRHGCRGQRPRVGWIVDDRGQGAVEVGGDQQPWMPGQPAPGHAADRLPGRSPVRS